MGTIALDEAHDGLSDPFKGKESLQHGSCITYLPSRAGSEELLDTGQLAGLETPPLRAVFFFKMGLKLTKYYIFTTQKNMYFGITGPLSYNLLDYIRKKTRGLSGIRNEKVLMIF